MVIVGIDEVGRGCWAGPLVVGAVALPQSFRLPTGAHWRLDDSKLLTAKARQATVAALTDLRVDASLGWVSSTEIDELGLTAAVRLAMQRAVDGLTAAYDEIVIDGSYNFLPERPEVRTLVKADRLVPAVSAASIMAKVARDNYMAEQAVLYPAYGFDRHVGYGTKQHIAALQQYGPCPLHRRSYKPIQQFV